MPCGGSVCGLSHLKGPSNRHQSGKCWRRSWVMRLSLKAEVVGGKFWLYKMLKKKKKNSTEVRKIEHCVLSHVWLLWSVDVACQAPLSMGFPRQKHWSGLPFRSPRDLPDPGIKPSSPALAGEFFTTSATWEAHERSPHPEDMLFVCITQLKLLPFPSAIRGTCINRNLQRIKTNCRESGTS